MYCFICLEKKQKNPLIFLKINHFSTIKILFSYLILFLVETDKPRCFVFLFFLFYTYTSLQMPRTNSYLWLTGTKCCCTSRPAPKFWQPPIASKNDARSLSKDSSGISRDSLWSPQTEHWRAGPWAFFTICGKLSSCELHPGGRVSFLWEFAIAINYEKTKNCDSSTFTNLTL